jgi:hypothetical protein
VQQTTNEALQTPADELTLQINGVCNENVVIRRDGVFLEGSDKATDGIHGVATGADIEPPVIRILGAVNVQLENLSIANGPRAPRRPQGGASRAVEEGAGSDSVGSRDAWNNRAKRAQLSLSGRVAAPSSPAEG